MTKKSVTRFHIYADEGRIFQLFWRGNVVDYGLPPEVQSLKDALVEKIGDGLGQKTGSSYLIT